ncbi:hypothetical protein E1258_27615 [Micromonospora sp. KC207]|uniref:hypothetical protein n=1 Tax=Micromonospora sp. KC207 TaxID=2530377 RepID=UPI001052CCD4|nr:hypothetical protein [Micromonospora sp. KC207]TDC48844.1 hypothetical protein E1258_27615 [Micromonospora sp. KC207]
MTARQLTPHLYQPDGDLPADHTGDQPCTCHLPRRHARHTVPDTADAQAEHLRRIGEDQD